MNVDINQEIDFHNLKDELPEELSSLLDLRDGPAQLAQELPNHFDPEEVAPIAGEPKSREQRLWELCGLYYLNHTDFPRPHEALPMFFSLYNQMLEGQGRFDGRSHKGMPLLTGVLMCLIQTLVFCR